MYPRIALGIVLAFVLSLRICPIVVAADEDLKKEIAELKDRVVSLEDYVNRLQPSLEEFSRHLLNQTDLKVKALSDKVIVLNPISKSVVKIESNSAAFLITVKEMEKLDNGARLHLQIGNPNAVTFNGVTLRMRWGHSWDPSFAQPTYEEWRSSLVEQEFAFEGDLPNGKWTEFAVDLVPTVPGQLEYIECEMEVKNVMLGNGSSADKGG